MRDDDLIGDRPVGGALPRPDYASSGAEDGPIALLRTLVAAFGRRKVPLGIWVAACVVFAALYARSLPPVYTAAATLILESQRHISPIGEALVTQPLDPNRAESELQVIRSERLQAQVFDGLGLANHPEFVWEASDTSDDAGAPAADPAAPDAAVADADAPDADISEVWADGVDPAETARQSAFAAFRERYSARRVGQSYVIEVSFSSSDPTLPARVANAAVSAYLLQSVASKAAAASAGAEFVQGRLDMLSAQVEDAAAAVVRGGIPERAVPDADARIIGAAMQPLSASAPRPKLLVAMGAVLGVMSGLFVLALEAGFDRRVRTAGRLSRETGIPTLGTMPDIDAPKPVQPWTFLPGARGARREGHAGALRDLRTAIDLACASGPQRESRVIAIVAWQAGAGCSLLCMQLAKLIQQSGRGVTVVDADINGGKRGLSARHAGHRALPAPKAKSQGGTAGEIRPVGEGAPAQELFLEVEGVSLLPAAALQGRGGSFADPRDPLVTQLLGMLRRRGDVLVDLPPLSESADAMALARHADAVIVVALAGRTSFDDMGEALRRLQNVKANVIGTVLNRV